MKKAGWCWRSLFIGAALATAIPALGREDIDNSWYGEGGASSPYALLSREDEPGFSYTPSPEQWRDRNIYQLFTDRFATDGVDRLGNYKPGWKCDNVDYPFNRNYHHGGSWKGLQNKIPYLQYLGVTAVWISGVQQNDQGANENRWTPYHQYHVDNFFRCDPAMGTFQDLKNLIDALHKAGIAVILDVAPNPMCDKNGWGTIQEDKGFHWDENGQHWWNDNNKHCAPFDNLDRFHVMGTINNWDQSPENLWGQFKGTDDLDQDDALTSDYLYRAFKNLIDATDCDGFRVDAIKHIPYDWCRNWAQAIRNHAAWRGKSNFLMFGELFSYDTSALASWCRDGYGFNSALLFPLMQAMNSVFGYGYSSYQLGEQMNAIQNYGDGKENVIAFLDNHDVNRFAMQFGGDSVDNAVRIMKPAMTFLYLAPPVPLLYYGTEHAFNQDRHGNGSQRSWDDSNPDDSDWQRECMFNKGFQPGNAWGDMFANWEADHGTRLCGHIHWLNDLRNKSRALRRGGFDQRVSSGSQGVYAFTKWYDDETALVIFNTADGRQDNVKIYTGRPNTDFQRDGTGDTIWSDDNGDVWVSVDGKDSLVYIHGFVDHSEDLGLSSGSSGSASGALWSANTYGWPKENATTADTIWVNTEAGPAATAAAAGADFKVWLVYGFNNPTGDWDKVEMELNEDWASANGGWYHASLGNLSTGRLDYIVCVETNAAGEGTYWDHNLNDPSGNYVLTISPEPDFSFASVGATPSEPEDGGDVTITAGVACDSTTAVSALSCVLKYDFEGTAWKTVAMEKAGVSTNVVESGDAAVTNLVVYFASTLTDMPGGKTLTYWVEATKAEVGTINSGDKSVRVKMSQRGIAWHCPTNHLVIGEFGNPENANHCMRWQVTPKAGESVDLTFGNYQGGDPSKTTAAEIKPEDEPMNMTAGTLYYQFVSQITDHSSWGAWSTAELGWADRNAHDNYWKGTVEVPANQAGNYLVYYFKSVYTNAETPVNKVGLQDTFVYMDPDNSAMYKRSLDEADAKASPFEVAIAGAKDGDEPGYMWHDKDIVRAGSDDKVRIQVKIGYQQPDGTRWADEVIVRYRIDSDEPDVPHVSGVKAIPKNARGARSWTSLPLQTNMTFQGTMADDNPVGDAMIWAVTLQDDRLLNDRAVLIYEIYARRKTESGGNGQWKQAEYNAGNGSCTFEYRMWSDGSGDLTVDDVPADYTTSKFFIDEAKGETVTVKVAYHAPDDPGTIAEVFSNFGRRDEADTDWDGDGWPDGMIPPDKNSVTTNNCEGGYWQAIPMKLRQGAWEAELTTGKCGVYRITARYKLPGTTNWIWYADGPDGALRRDHVVVISPKKAMEQTMYELNVLTTKATGCSNDKSGNFEELSEKLSDRDNFGEFSIDYLNRLGVNCLWFQPIHPNLDYARGNTDGNGNRYYPGSPYATKNYFSVNYEMSKDKDEAKAVAAFTNFVRLCDKAQSDTPPAGGVKNLDTINVMLDGVLNHTSFDAVFGEGWAMATRDLTEKAQAELDADPNFGSTWRNITAADTIPNTALGIRWYSHVVDDGHNQADPASYWNGVDDNDIANAPERYDFGKWNDVAELLYGNYSTMVKYDDRASDGSMGKETGRVYSNEDQYYYDQMSTATKMLWKYMACYPEYWITKTGNDGVNHWDASDDLGIDGLRCDYAQGLPNQFWEYTVNRTRAKKWNFIFMAESLDGGAVGFRSNRQFDILNENMVFRFTQDHVSYPGDFQKALEDRRESYGNGLILLNLTCHDEVMPWGDAQATASRYAMVSAIDGVPMIFYGQEQAICKFERNQGDDGNWYGDDPDDANEWKGFVKFEQNFGKWIPHFKTWNAMHVWTNPPCKAGEPNDSRAMAEFYGRINLARQQSPALRSQNRWFLNDSNKVMFVAKWEEEGALQKGKDAVFAAVLFLNDNMEGDHNGHWGAGCTYDISPFAAKMGILNRADRLYNVVNLASTSTNFLWDEPKSGEELYANGLEITFQGSWRWNEQKGDKDELPATEWTDGGNVVQFLRVVDVSGFVPDDGLAILDPDPEASPLELAAGTASYAVVGTAGADVSGSISWTNALTGGNGTFAKSDTWTQTVPLATGTNVVTFSATTEATVTTTDAEDKASNAAYSGDFVGLNGGTGFGAWSLENDGVGGSWTDNRGFGIWCSATNTTTARRTLNRALKAGDTFSVDFFNNSVASGGGCGFGLGSADDQDAGFRIWYNGGSSGDDNHYGTTAGNTSFGWTNSGLHIVVTMTSDVDFSAKVSVIGASDSSTFTGQFKEACDRFRFWTTRNKEYDGANNDVLVDNLKLTATTSASGESASASVTIVVLPGDEPGPGPEEPIQIDSIVSFDPATGRASVKISGKDVGTLASVPYWTTDVAGLVAGEWAGKGSAPVVDGEVQLNLVLPENGALFLTFSEPPAKE